MEHASADDMPEDAEHKEIGTPATRAGVIEVTGNEAVHGRWWCSPYRYYSCSASFRAF